MILDTYGFWILNLMKPISLTFSNNEAHSHNREFLEISIAQNVGKRVPFFTTCKLRKKSLLTAFLFKTESKFHLKKHLMQQNSTATSSIYSHILVVHRQDDTVCRLSSTISMQLLEEPLVYGIALNRCLIFFRWNSCYKTHSHEKVAPKRSHNGHNSSSEKPRCLLHKKTLTSWLMWWMLVVCRARVVNPFI